MNLSRKQFAQFAQISLVAATAMAAATAAAAAASATAATRTKCKYLPQNIWQNIAEERRTEPGGVRCSPLQSVAIVDADAVSQLQLAPYIIIEIWKLCG